MSIPKNITKEHLLKAITKIDDEGIPEYGQSQYYDVIYEGKKYPPKLIISYANLFANGEILDRNVFHGGKGAPSFKLLERNGFLIEEKINKDDFSFYQELIKFLDQAQTLNLKTSNYLRHFRGLDIKVSFGQGNQAKIPWFAFLNEKDTVQEGIYPGYLYFKKYKLLILAYCVSETHKPSRHWNETNLKTIERYFKEKGLGKPERYGNSYVFKSYDLNQQLIESEINEDLNELIAIYKETDGNRTLVERKKMTTKEIIQHSYNYLRSLGFKYEFEEVANFYLSLKAKPFVILAGISGTGKTQLPRKFAASLGFSDEQVIQLPVRPDWADSSDILGYTALNGNFIPKDLTIAIQKALANPNQPYFFILDEMNLARVEHYFSDFLSVIETRERVGKEIKTDPILREEVFKAAKNKSDFISMGWPQNLFLIGTVNMDETTHSFSRKVLDRANSIEMNEVDLSWIKPNGEKVPKLSDISNALFQTDYIHSIELTDAEKSSIDFEMKILEDVNKILQEADLHFAYRVRDEIAFYLIINKKNEIIDSNCALDFQIVQKILPRIHGSSERVQTVLVELLNLLEAKDFRSSNFEFSMLDGKIDLTSLKYRRASKKIIFMLKRYDDDRFTSFWL